MEEIESENFGGNIMKLKRFAAGALSLCLVGGIMPFANVIIPAANAAESSEESEIAFDGDFVYAKYSDHAELIGHKKIGEDLDAEINLPDKIEGVPLTVIRRGLFANRDEIVSVTLPETLTVIGSEVFAGCENLASINIPEGVIEIGGGAFGNCLSLESINIPSGLKIIETGLFAYSGLKAVNIPQKVEVIGYAAFLGCENLTSIVIPENVKILTEFALYQCVNMESITIENLDCKIGDVPLDDPEDPEKRVFTGTIYGYKGSTAQAYAEKYGYKFEDIELKRLGDVNQDGSINALDASKVLTAYASTAIGKDSGLTDSQKKSADVNKDGAIDALDASVILSYYAYTATGGTGSLADFLNK